jgi:antitoxin MazE
MDLVKVKRHYQITLPANFRKKFNINEGDYMELEDTDGQLIIRPVKMIRPGQEYFYTKEWQEGEAEADKDIAKGDVVGPFDNIEDSLEALKKAKI